MTDLTGRQADVLAAVVSLTADLGYPPTVTELAAELGACRSVTHVHLQKLRRAGVITWQPRSPRTVRVVAEAAA